MTYHSIVENMKRIPRFRALKCARRNILLQNKIKRRLRKRSVGKARFEFITIFPPDEFNFSTNYHDTVFFLRELKRAALQRKEGQRIFIDLKRIRAISQAGALVLAAEIDRWRKKVGRSVRPIDIAAWNVQVVAKLNALGFFRPLGTPLPKKMKAKCEKVYDGKELTILPLISATEMSNEKIADLIGNLLGLVADIFQQDAIVYEALAEAMYNCSLHAYPAGFQFEFEPIDGGWWASGSWDTRNESLKFWVYDQGVGIPATLPTSGLQERISEFIARLPGVGNVAGHESLMIRAALEVDRSSLGGGHGKGLQDVVKPARMIAGAKVRILSGRGGILYSDEETTTRMDERLHLGGTLVEWTIPAIL